MIYEKSIDDGITWKPTDKVATQIALNNAYVDGGLMMANLIAGLVVVTPYAKYRVRNDTLEEDSI